MTGPLRAGTVTSQSGTLRAGPRPAGTELSEHFPSCPLGPSPATASVPDRAGLSRRLRAWNARAQPEALPSSGRYSGDSAAAGVCRDSTQAQSELASLPVSLPVGAFASSCSPICKPEGNQCPSAFHRARRQSAPLLRAPIRGMKLFLQEKNYKLMQSL